MIQRIGLLGKFCALARGTTATAASAARPPPMTARRWMMLMMVLPAGEDSDSGARTYGGGLQLFRRADRAALEPGLHQRAEPGLRAGRGHALAAGRPRPADELVLAHVLQQSCLVEVAVARRVRHLPADLAQRAASPCHRCRRQA